MPDEIEKAYSDVRTLAQDYFGIGESESVTLMKLAKQCAQVGGIPMAGLGAAAMAGVGSVTVPLVGAIPGFLAGALAGFLGGTTACMIARRSTLGQVQQILGKTNMSEQEFKASVRSLISKAEGQAGYCKAT